MDVGPRVVIMGASGFTNLGDDAILAAMLPELRAALPAARFAIASGDPAQPLLRAPDIDPLPFADNAIAAALDGADLLIIGGDGFIYDYEMRVRASDCLEGNRAFFYPYYRAALAAEVRGAPVYWYAIGVGPLLTAAGRDLTRDVLSRAAAITVRDPLSLYELHAAGLRVPTPELTADPAVRLPPVAGSGRGERRRVGFVARAWLEFGGSRTPSSAAYFARVRDWFATAADYVVEQWDAEPVFLPLQHLNDDDSVVEAAIIARMRHGGRARVLDELHDFRALQAAVAGLDAIVSGRLHPLILAAGAGVPLIGVELRPKVRAFLGTLGLNEYALSPWVARDADLRAALDRVLGDPAPIQAQLRAGMAAQAAAAARNPAIAAELLRERAARSVPA
ncbi:MAG: polysaccharide pyruvyl transferase family protein [Thermomicrobiales bacterium]